MPFKFRLKRARRYNVSSKNSYVVCVHLLDKTLIECTLTADSTGYECLENIAQRNELNEADYFGLRYVNKKLQFRWVELDKPLKKQLDKHAHSPLLYFGVMFYVADAHKIQDEMARDQYYLQLKTDVIEGKLPCTPEQAVLLAAYSMQAEFGDYDSEKDAPEQRKDVILLPRTMSTDERTQVELTQEIVNTHRSLQGVAPSVAELNYIIEAQQLEGYGLEYFPAKGDGNIDLLIGASFIGIFVKPLNSQPTMYFKWSDIINLTQSSRKLSLETSLTDKNVNFHMDDPDTAKYVYKVITLQHQFCKNKNNYIEQTSLKVPLDAGPPGSGGVMPDVQLSAQPRFDSHDQSLDESSGSDKNWNDSNQTMIIHDSFGYDQSPITPNDPSRTTANGHVFNVNHSDTGQIHSTPVQALNNNNLHSVPQSTSTPNYVNRVGLVPAYRPTPDYETVMRQRMEQMGQVAQSGQTIHMQQPSVDQTQLANQVNISHSQVYSHPETMAYSQPEISHNLPPSYIQYLAHRGIVGNGSAAHMTGESSGSSGHSPQRPVDRTSSLIIHPTYSTPELNTQGMPSQFSTSENHLINEAIYNHYKPPPPYPRPSISTPDLATQTGRNNASSSPDLVSRRNLNNATLVTQSQLDQSVENLAVDTHNLLISQHKARSSQNMLDDTSSGTQSESFLHCTPGSIPDVAVSSSNNVSLVNLSSADFQEVMITSPPQPRPQTHIQSTVDTSIGHSVVDGRLQQTPSGENLASFCQGSPSIATSHYQSTPTSNTSGNNTTTTSWERSQYNQNMLPAPVLSSDDQPMYILPDTDSDVVEHLPSISPQQQANHQKTNSVNSSTSSASPAGPSSSHMTPSQTSSQSDLKTPTPDSDDDDYEDIESENKRLSIGPLKLAAMNGLTISSGSILDTVDRPAPDSSRAPKDDRRKQLENKLEEGQVFVEFEQVYKKKIRFETNIASQPDNKERNRFKDVLPYDDNRVKLMPRKDNPTGYVNASHIKMQIGKEEWWYVAAQGPLPNTVQDFWQMAWEQEVEVVAMLTGLAEHGRPKCTRYWPEKNGTKNKMKFGEYEVTMKFSKNSGPYTTCGLILRHTKLKKERLVWHLQYTDWPDHGCPEDPHGFLAYLDEIEAVRRQVMIERKEERAIPIVVHCSAGVGRSGVVILTEVVKACLEFNQEIDIPAVLRQMRDQRMYMVQTVSQYSFVYKTLVEYLKGSRLI